jgi:serine/threonine protein kinase
MSFIVCKKGIDVDSFLSLQSISVHVKGLANSRSLWGNVPHVLANGKLNLSAFKLIREKCKGTEGTCFHAFSRPTKRHYAVKKARVYPNDEGVPYYMMRELASLKKINHPNICCLETVNLNFFVLHLIFPYVELTLFDIMTKMATENEKKHGKKTIVSPLNNVETQDAPLEEEDVQALAHQLLCGVEYCHRRGILHRNLKPKHLLITPGPDPEKPLRGARLQIADFALVRILGHPPKRFTTEVITLWYRPPEILMGEQQYSAAVDIWSVGCIIAEMARGQPLFTGLCEIDQLFQIFFKMGNPAPSDWPAFEKLPHYNSGIFPNWPSNQLPGLLTRATDSCFDIITSLVRYNPETRLSAKEALEHGFFTDSTQTLNSSWEQSRVLSETLEIPSSSSSSSTLAQLASEYIAFPEQRFLADGHTFTNLSKTTLQQVAFLHHLEASAPVLNREHRIEGKVRRELICWLAEVVSEYVRHMCLRTLYFATALMDRSAEVRRDPAITDDRESDEDSPTKRTDAEKETSKLLAATCVHIASKCEDVQYVSIRDLAEKAAFITEAKEILLMEETVMNDLQFDVYIPTTIDFVTLFMECVPELNKDGEDQEDAVLTHLVRYISEVTLLSADFLDYKPSAVAACCVRYALLMLKRRSWPPGLLALSRFEPYCSDTKERSKDYCAIMKAIEVAHRLAGNCNEREIYERYDYNAVKSVSKLDVYVGDF